MINERSNPIEGNDSKNTADDSFMNLQMMNFYPLFFFILSLLFF